MNKYIEIQTTEKFLEITSFVDEPITMTQRIFLSNYKW